MTDEMDLGLVSVFEGTVSLISERTTFKTKVSTSFQRKITRNGYFSLKSTLSFSAIIPDSSEIFTLVRTGDLEGIIKHVQQGQASLTNCDLKGRSLLNVRKACL